MQPLSLKQYMDSKRQLLSAIENTPVSVIEYEIRKYCTLSIGESTDSAVTIALKPRQKILIEWVYTNKDHPTPEKISILDKESGEPLDEQSIYWNDIKLNKWLSRYAKDGINYGHNVKK